MDTTFIFGPYSAGFYVGWLLFALLGFLLHKYILFLNRGNRGKFRWKFFWQDNMYDFLGGFLVAFIGGRFHLDILSAVSIKDPSSGNSMFLALMFGMAFTTIMQILRKTKFGNFIKSNNFPDGTKRRD